VSDNPAREVPDARSFEERVFARFDALGGRLTALEEKVDMRLQETRPIWEGVPARLDVIEKEVKDIGRGMELLHKDFFKARRNQGELRERVEKLESRPAR
jgi:hypothetical protein